MEHFKKIYRKSAEATTDDNGEVQITATIDGHSKTITEASLRRHLKLDDHDGQEVDLFPTMLNVSAPSHSPSRITSSPSHSPEPSPSHLHEPSIEHSPDHTTAAVSFPSPTQPTQPSPRAEQHIPTPHDSPLHAVHSHGSDEEAKVKAGTARKGAWVILSEDNEDVEDDSSKQGMKLSDADSKEGKQAQKRTYYSRSTASEVPVISTAEEKEDKEYWNDQDQGSQLRRYIGKILPVISIML
ncbi:hypothetical protein Tco_0796580 [Tanacetum coccineum]